MPFIGELAAVAVVLWLTQLALSYQQARLFSRRIRELRKQGLCATGLAGGAYRGRAYVVLVVHPLTHNIIKAELLRGITVFAKLKPFPQLEGYTIDDLLDKPDLTIPDAAPKVIEAARSAAAAIRKSQNKTATDLPISTH